MNKKIISLLTAIALVFNSLAPIALSSVYAQEASGSATLIGPSTSPTPQPSPSPEPVENIATVSATPSPSPSPTPQSTPAASLWVTNPDGSATTTSIVSLGVTYKAPQNDKVSLTFTKLPEGSGTVTVKEVNALGTTAYDITSTMTDGTFEYTLTLPTSTTEKVEVKASEDGQNFVTLGGVSLGDGVLTVTGLNHFTIFVVVGTISGTPATATSFNENQANVVINEFVYNAATEWVEIYNRSANAIDISGWILVDLANNVKNIPLNTIIPGNGFYVFETSNWLNNTGTETINLKNGSTLVDQVSYKDGTVVGAQDIGTVAVGQSVARTADGGANWAADTTPSKGWRNALASPTTVYVDDDASGVKTGSSNQPFSTIQEGIDAVAAGGTVNVLAGNYSENITIDQRSLTLNGAGVGQSTISNDPCDAELIAINTNNVTIQNFTLDDGGECGESVVTLNSQGDGISGIIIRNNEIINGSRGIETLGTVSSLQILNNSIHDNESFGIQVASGTNITISNNKIFNNVTGVQNQGSSSIDARGNFWGHSSGPKHLTLNPSGQGNNVSNSVLFKPWYLTDALTNLDSTAPIITFSMPLPNMTLPSSITVIASTNEAATCTYSLDGGANSSMGTTGGTSHTKALSGLTLGNHAIRLSCTDASGNSSTSSTVSWTVIDFNNIQSNVIFNSATLGQADLPNGITTLNLTNTTNFDVSAGLKSASGNNITIGGVPMNLSNFTSGDLAGKNLSGIQSIGGVNFEIQKAVALKSGKNGQPILLKNSDLSGVNVSLPDGVSVLAPNGWGGTIQPPKTGSSTGTTPSGFSVGSTVIEVGSADLVLLFDRPVTVILTGVTGPVGYKSAGSTTWTKITNTCGGTYAIPTPPTFPGECAISNGTDTKIVTYHFTSFAALNAASSTSNSSSSSSDSGGGASAPSCNDKAAGGIPTLLSATVSGPNSVSLTWSKAADPVTHYVVTYGLSSGEQRYGNPNVGGKDTTSYTVGSLSGGTTYYFKVRAGNGCNAGPYSNELSATPSGGIVTGPASDFQAGVLGAKTTVETVQSKGESPGESVTKEVTVNQPAARRVPVNFLTGTANFFKIILNFFATLFK